MLIMKILRTNCPWKVFYLLNDLILYDINSMISLANVMKWKVQYFLYNMAKECRKNWCEETSHLCVEVSHLSDSWDSVARVRLSTQSDFCSRCWINRPSALCLPSLQNSFSSGCWSVGLMQSVLLAHSKCGDKTWGQFIVSLIMLNCKYGLYNRLYKLQITS